MTKALNITLAVNDITPSSGNDSHVEDYIRFRRPMVSASKCRLMYKHRLLQRSIAAIEGKHYQQLTLTSKRLSPDTPRHLPAGKRSSSLLSLPRDGIRRKDRGGTLNIQCGAKDPDMWAKPHAKYHGPLPGLSFRTMITPHRTIGAILNGINRTNTARRSSMKMKNYSLGVYCRSFWER